MPEMKGSLTNGVGVYSYKDKKLQAPKKGSELPMRNKGNNADREKVISQAKEQSKKESLRGKMG